MGKGSSELQQVREQVLQVWVEVGELQEALEVLKHSGASAGGQRALEERIKALEKRQAELWALKPRREEAKPKATARRKVPAPKRGK